MEMSLMLTVTLHDTSLLHARPASIIAVTAKGYESVVMLSADTQIADAKNPLSLMRLHYPLGTPLELLADGPDEAAALEAVADAIHTALGGTFSSSAS